MQGERPSDITKFKIVNESGTKADIVCINCTNYREIELENIFTNYTLFNTNANDSCCLCGI